MKKNIYYLLFIVLLIGCKKEIKSKKNFIISNTIDNNKIGEKVLHDFSKKVSQNINVRLLNFDIEEIDDKKLVGMGVSNNTKESDPYKKYLLDISNYCYSCNLAAISINKKRVKVENFCDSQSDLNRLNFNIKNSAKLIFSIEKINNAPIYKLEIQGVIKTDLVIKKFYTIEDVLSKFEIHDCGNFDG